MFRKILIILFIGFLNLNSNAFSNDKVLQSLKEGKKLVFIRHAIAPGNGDPNNFDINDCSTQRNLNKDGIEQSKKIGKFLKVAFKNYETFKGLNSFYDEKFYKYKDDQIKSLRTLISNWDGKKNIIFVTHFVVISEIFNISVSSGEMLISDKNYSIVGNIETN